jgi:hypothetical protein
MMNTLPSWYYSSIVLAKAMTTEYFILAVVIVRGLTGLGNTYVFRSGDEKTHRPLIVRMSYHGENLVPLLDAA